MHGQALVDIRLHELQFTFEATMEGLLQAPRGMQLRDKFLVQTTVVPQGTSDKQLAPAFISKENDRYIEESKLSVVLVSVHQSLEEQPTNGIQDTGPGVPNIENEVPEVPNEVPAPLVTEDFRHLKSKLNNLESKLEQTEKTMTRLQRGMDFLLLFMVFIMALLCISLGYLLRSPEPRMLRKWQDN